MTRRLPLPAKPGSTLTTVGLAVAEFLAFIAVATAVDSGSGMSRITITLLVCVARAAARRLGLPSFTLSGRPA
jgi:hypothetical protein